MPALLTTQLVDEVPVVAIIAEDSPLTAGVERLFIDAGFLVRTFSPKNLQLEKDFLTTDWYKIVWINLPQNWETKEYLSVCTVLTSCAKSQIVILPVAGSITEPQTPQELTWWQQSQLQTQVIVDCNYYLQSATFVFIQDLIDESIFSFYTSALDNITKNLEENQLLQVGGSIFPQTTTQALSALSSLLFKTTLAPSTQVLGKKLFVRTAVEHIKKEYEAYYGVVLSVYESPLKLHNPLPFLTQTLEVSSQDALEVFIRTLPVVTQKTTKNQDFLEKLLPQPKEEIKITQKTTRSSEQRPPSLPSVSSLVPRALESQEKQTRVVGEKTLVAKEDVQKIFQTTRQHTKTEHIQELVKTHVTTTKKTKRKKSLFYIGVSVVAMGLGALLLAGVFWSSVFLLKKEIVATMHQVNEGDISYSNQLKKMTSVVSFQTKTYSTIFSLPELTKTEHLVDIAEKIMLSIDNKKTLDGEQAWAMQMILGRENDNLVGAVADDAATTPTQLTNAERLARLQKLAQENFETTSYLRGLLATEDSQIALDNSDVFSKNLDVVRDSLLVKQQFFSLLPLLFPENEKKTYAVLFQNDQELRPTGGFIQAVGFITVTNGQIDSITTKSSYEVDKALLGETTPPPELTRYLGEKRFYFHDSNWNPDYPTSAKQAQWFIEQATNQELAGVVGLTTKSLVTLLEATGPIDLLEFNEVITAKNLQERMEFHSEVTLVENSGLPDYSSLLLKKILEKIQSLPEEKSNTLGTALVKALSHQELVVFSEDSRVQDGWQALGWSGAIVSPECPTQLATTPCLVEPVAQVETSVGINKANYYLERSIQHQVTLNELTNTHKRTITYVNTARSEAWPKGSYKSFVRFLLPQNASAIEVSISGVPIPSSQIESWQENNRVGVGLYLEVPIQQSREVFLSFVTPREKSDNYSYVFFDQKQPGSDTPPFSLELINKKHSPLAVAPQAEVLENSVVFSQDQATHLFFGAQY